MSKPATLLKQKNKNKNALVKVNKNQVDQKNKNISVNPENLISQAITQKLPIESLEKLLAMRRELKNEWAEEQYYRSLAKFQSICPIIKKTKIVYNKDGKTIRYKYAPLEDIINQIKSPLEECGLSYDLDSKFLENEYIAICNVHHINGFSKQFNFSVPIEDSQYMNSIQKVGSTRTYANRYNFCNALGIMTEEEDDDANNTQEIEEDKKINNNPVCPKCNKNDKVIKSKYPGKQWYCLECKVSFNEKIKDVSPKKENKIDNERELANKVLDKVKTPVIEKSKEPEKLDPRIQELLDKTKPYKDQLTKEQIHFLFKLSKKTSYTETEYLEDSVFIDELIKTLNKGKKAQIINNDDKEFPEFNDKKMEQEIDTKFHKEVYKITKSLQKDIDRK